MYMLLAMFICDNVVMSPVLFVLYYSCVIFNLGVHLKQSLIVLCYT